MAAAPKTRPTGADVTAFLDAAPAARRADGHELRALFEQVTGEPAVMWGPSMVGFGTYELSNSTGTNEWFVVGFSPRSTALTLYGLHGEPGTADHLLDDLGPHTLGKSCLYVKRLDAVDRGVLERMIRAAWDAQG